MLAGVLALLTLCAAIGVRVVGATDLPLATPALPLATPSLPVALPTPSLPLPTPSLPLPTPSLPLTAPSLPVPAPSLSPTPPGSTPTPAAQPPPATPGSTAPPAPTDLAGRGVAYRQPGDGSPPAGGLTLGLPSVTFPSGPAGLALALAFLVAVAALPLLIGIALLSMGRMWGAAASLRSARLRMALAAELELPPRELATLSPTSLVKLRDQVAFDELSGVLRRVAGVAAVEREIARARRHKTELTAVFVDLDGLKRVNDSRGHAAGDELIRGVARLLSGALRKNDLVFRYGGDEFVCLLSGVSEEVTAEKFQELRARARQRGMAFSFGTGALAAGDDTVSLLARADQRLYDHRARKPTISPVASIRRSGG
jgi:diguanylate cyclase (GGDEF)-like protein